MKEPRQQERRQLFSNALSRMPFWETWTTRRNKLSDAEHFNACRDAGMELERETVERGNFKLIPRRKRRAMARELAKMLRQNAHA